MCAQDAHCRYNNKSRIIFWTLDFCMHGIPRWRFIKCVENVFQNAMHTIFHFISECHVVYTIFCVVCSRQYVIIMNTQFCSSCVLRLHWRPLAFSFILSIWFSCLFVWLLMLYSLMMCQTKNLSLPFFSVPLPTFQLPHFFHSPSIFCQSLSPSRPLSVCIDKSLYRN